MPHLPRLPRARKLLALAVAVFALAGVSAQQPDPLPSPLPLPPKPGTATAVLAPDRLPATLPAKIGFPVPSGEPMAPLPVGGPALPPLPVQPAQPAAPTPSVKYVNKPVVEFDYEVTRKGRAGVKAVSLWVQPKTVPGAEWKQVTSANPTEDVPAKLSWDMPADGSYGFRVQLTGNNDRKSVEFKPETQPEMVVIRDTVPPVVKDVRLDPPAAGQKQAVIRWTASDANLGDKCVKLEYEQKAGGGWAVIAEAELNSGSLAWQLDDKLPVSTRVRVTVTDLAGNTASATSETPTNLDPVVPEGRLTGVRGVELSIPSIPPVSGPSTIPDSPRPDKLELPPVPPTLPLEPKPNPIPKARG